MQTIHLQNIGSLPAIPASELKPGMLLSWNYQFECCEVVSVTETSAKSLSLVTRYFKDGETFTSRIRKTTLVAASLKN